MRSKYIIPEARLIIEVVCGSKGRPLILTIWSVGATSDCHVTISTMIYSNKNNQKLYHICLFVCEGIVPTVYSQFLFQYVLRITKATRFVNYCLSPKTYR